MSGEQRRDARFPVQVEVTLLQRDGEVALVTADVGYRGVFLRTASPPRLRALMMLRIQLAPDETFTCHGMAVHHVGPDDPAGRAQGVGVQFYGLDEPTRRQWSAYVERLQAKRRSHQSADGVREPVTRKAARIAARFVVRVRSARDLHTFTTRDVSRAGMFLRTTERFQQGTPLFLEVVHEARPPLCFEALVRRCATELDAQGIGVELRQPDPQTLDALLALAEDAQAHVEAITEHVVEYDPQLE